MTNVRKNLRSFGRRRGRKPRSAKQRRLDALLPQLAITLPPQGMLDLRALFPAASSYWLEIGFGGGERLAAAAKVHPGAGHIGCEPYVDGIGSLLAHIEAEKITNIRLYPDDARDLIARLPEACLARVDILYPDPWPKARHHKRRLVNAAFLSALARVMKPGAILQLATDHADYLTWMLEHLLAAPDFAWEARGPQDWRDPPPGWVRTRYEQKAITGEKPVYLTFLRRENQTLAHLA